MSRRLSFLHLTTFYPPYSFGGDAMYLYRLCHMLGDQGHHIDVIHCVDSFHLLHPAPPRIAFTEHPNVTRHELRSGYKSLSPFLTQQTGRPLLKKGRILELLAGRKYDVVHFHNMSLLGPETLTIDAGEAVKLYTTHEHWLICPMHVLWKMNSRACDKPECLRCVLHGKRPPQLWRHTGMLDRAARHVDRFVSPSRFTARMHAERGFSREVGHLPYFIDRADQDWQQPAPRPQQNPYFLFVGRLEEIKGLQTVIPLWEQIRDHDLLIVGTGNYEAELKALAADNPRIVFLGPKPQKELGALYRHAVATLVPSVTYETFGMIIVESFARKTPVIVRDLGALPELIQESGGGLIFRNDQELLASLRRLADEPQTCAQMGESGYRAFVRHWSPEAHKKAYFGLIEEAAQEKLGRALQPEFAETSAP